MNLSDLNEKASKYKARRRVGRGHSSGHGKTSGRGHKGQKSRSGYRRQLGYEGGQTSLFRRFPKRGFHNKWRTDYDVINVSELNVFAEGDTVTLKILSEKAIVKSRHARLKILGDGKLERKLTIEANKFSQTARRQIEELGGEAREV